MRLRGVFAVSLAMLGIALAAGRAPAQRADLAITVTNQDGVARRFTIADLRALPQVDVKVEGNHGAALIERGPSMRIVIGVESHRARWVRNLLSLKIVKAG